MLRRQRAPLQSVTRGRPGGDQEGVSATSAATQSLMKVKVLAEPRQEKNKNKNLTFDLRVGGSDPARWNHSTFLKKEKFTRVEAALNWSF